MKVVALASRKGGAGKSTICVHLAVAAEAAGLVTAIFDLDPQASAALWSDHRGEPIPAVVPAQAPRLRALLQQAVERGADLVLLDTPPHADGVSADAGALADAILIPCRPSAFDLDAIGASVRLAQASKKPCWVIINAAPTQGSEVLETETALRSAGVEVAPIVIHQRKAFSARAHEGRTAQEIEPGGKAAREVDDLLTWLCGAIGISLDDGTKVAGQPASKTITRDGHKGSPTEAPEVVGSRVEELSASPGPRHPGSALPRFPTTKLPRQRGSRVAKP